MKRVNLNSRQILLGCAVMLAFLVQSMIPHGYMPNFKSHQFFEITICQGVENRTILVDENLNPVSQKTKDQSHQQNKHSSNKSCLFAPVSFQSFVIDNFVYTYLSLITYEFFSESNPEYLYQTTSTSPYLSQGPPNFLS